MVWDFVKCSDFPSTQPRILDLGEIWLIAFADDIVILSISSTKLQDVLSKLFNELKKFNLSINLIKTETLTFVPPRIRTQAQSIQFSLDNTTLAKVELFKYLGMFVSSSWGFSNHITRMQGRAEAAAVELTRLADRLDIRSPERISVYFRSLVDSQWHGLELLPLSVASDIESTRAHFIRKFYDLPCSTANMLTLVLLDLWPATFEALMRRVAFSSRMTVHDLAFVRCAFEFDKTVLFRAKTGWHHEAFLLFRSLFTREKIADFSIQRVSDRLSVVQRARTRFLFCLLKETEESTLAPFRLFDSPDVLLSFRSLLGLGRSRRPLLISFFLRARQAFVSASSTGQPCDVPSVVKGRG